MKGKVKLIAAAAAIAVAVPVAVVFSQRSESVSTDSDSNIQNVISNEQTTSASEEMQTPVITDESVTKAKSDENALRQQGEYHGPSATQAEGLPQKPVDRGADPYMSITTTKEIQ